MSGDDNFFDPRLYVFIIWGIFVVLFICVPSKRLVARLCHLVGCTCIPAEVEENDGPSPSSQNAVQYDFLSNLKKQEIDFLRASYITYRAYPFSKTLVERDLICVHVSGGESSHDERIADGQPPQDSTEQKPLFEIEDSSPRIVGIEPKSETGSSSAVAEKARHDELVEFTHILVPQPGHNFDDHDMTLAHTEPGEEDKKRSKGESGKHRSRSLLFSKKESEEGNAAGQPAKKLVNEPAKAVRRQVPMNCAICLEEYEVGERVTWSANPDCRHVFHENCLLGWLVSLGKAKSKNVRYTDSPTESELLDFELECPCCRQAFVTKSNLGIHRGNDESV
mmetsp:Transcript_19107/g.44735  ORF Transcript_19107/g.44735 Transcript_19107/m.44735 type:complete len:336 (+) Transcript_19107:211-1218(+)